MGNILQTRTPARSRQVKQAAADTCKRDHTHASRHAKQAAAASCWQYRALATWASRQRQPTAGTGKQAAAGSGRHKQAGSGSQLQAGGGRQRQPAAASGRHDHALQPQDLARARTKTHTNHAQKRKSTQSMYENSRPAGVLAGAGDAIAALHGARRCLFLAEETSRPHRSLLHIGCWFKNDAAPTSSRPTTASASAPTRAG